MDVALGGRVGLGGGLVQDEDGGVLEVGARQGDALTLPSGEEPARITQDRVVAMGQTCDALVDAGRPGSRLDLLPGGVGTSQGDVVVDGLVGQGHVLQHDRHAREQPGESRVAHVDAADAHGAVVDVVEAGDEAGQGRLATTGGADERCHGSRLGGEGHAVQDRGTGLVGEGDVLDVDAPGGGPLTVVTGSLGHRRQGEQVGGGLGGHPGLVHVLHEADEGHEPLREPEGHQEERQGR